MAGPEQVCARALVCDVSELTDPDVAVVDALARLQLAAARCGCQISLRGASRQLRDLLRLMGLADVVGCGELVRQPEQREQGGTEEVGDPDDPAV